VQVLQTKVSRLKELEMFLDELASEIVLANLILASLSFANEPIGLKGMAEPPFRWRTARELSLELRTALYPAGKFSMLVPKKLVAVDSCLESSLPDRPLF
jgi:hypothetical protein